MNNTKTEFFIQEWNKETIDWGNWESSPFSTIESASHWIKIWQREFPRSQFRMIKRITIETEQVME
jgi:hypothetical protein